MGLILNDLKNACELEHVCDYVNNRTTSSMNYISTENMLPNKGGCFKDRIALFYWTVVKSIDKTWNQI